jgi:hypothetical protein
LPKKVTKLRLLGLDSRESVVRVKPLSLRKKKPDASHLKLVMQRILQKVKGEVVVAGLYENIHAKRKRIAAGSKEKMRKPGSKGAPTAKAFKQAAKTAKKRKK